MNELIGKIAELEKEVREFKCEGKSRPFCISAAGYLATAGEVLRSHVKVINAEAQKPAEGAEKG